MNHLDIEEHFCSRLPSPELVKQHAPKLMDLNSHLAVNPSPLLKVAYRNRLMVRAHCLTTLSKNHSVLYPERYRWFPLSIQDYLAQRRSISFPAWILYPVNKSKTSSTITSWEVNPYDLVVCLELEVLRILGEQNDQNVSSLYSIARDLKEVSLKLPSLNIHSLKIQPLPSSGMVEVVSVY